MRCFALVITALIFTLSGCVSTPPVSHTIASASEASRQEQPIMVLISIDGFRPDYLERGLTPHLNALRQAGAYGEMYPSFPSVTFPNHYTLVTGLRPDHHGIIANTMRDERRPEQHFYLSNYEAVTDAFWWEGGTPFWVTAELAGVKTGTFFWPGSEAPIHGVRPSKYARYSKDTSVTERVETLLSWIDLPEAERPKAYTLYFEAVDTQGHNYGPESSQVNAAISETDASIGRFLAGLKARGLEGRINIIVVSDHGMAAHDSTKFVYLKDLLPEGAYEVLGGQVAGITPLPGREAEIEALLLKPHAHMECWKKAEIPARYHFGSHPRIPPFVCLAQVGGYIVAPSRNNWSPKSTGGSHGYDPYAPEMRSVFIAAGPDVKAGARLSAFDNVDVYSLIMHLMGLEALPGDGSLDSLRPALKD